MEDLDSRSAQSFSFDDMRCTEMHLVSKPISPSYHRRSQVCLTLCTRNKSNWRHNSLIRALWQYGADSRWWSVTCKGWFISRIITPLIIVRTISYRMNVMRGYAIFRTNVCEVTFFSFPVDFVARASVITHLINSHVPLEWGVYLVIEWGLWDTAQS